MAFTWQSELPDTLALPYAATDLLLSDTGDWISPATARHSVGVYVWCGGEYRFRRMA